MTGPTHELEERRKRIATYVDGKWLSRLGPVVDWVADRIDPPATHGAPVFRALPQGCVRLVPVTRKMLAFDRSARLRPIATAAVALYVGWPVTNLVYTRLAKGHEETWVHISIDLVLACVWFLGLVYAVAVRLRTLRRLLTTCVVVPSRVIACERAPQEKEWPSKHYSMTFEYWYAGQAFQVSERYVEPECALIGWTPELLLSPSDPESILIRDFYT